MSTPKDGGSAFPCPRQSAPELGISLRAYFAGQAMQALISCHRFDHEGVLVIDKANIAESSVATADALIAELNKERSK